MIDKPEPPPLEGLTGWAIAQRRPWPRVVGRKFLRELPCPICGKAGCETKIVAARCHPYADLIAFTQNGVLYVACGMCFEPVLPLAIGEP